MDESNSNHWPKWCCWCWWPSRKKKATKTEGEIHSKNERALQIWRVESRGNGKVQSILQACTGGQAMPPSGGNGNGIDGILQEEPEGWTRSWWWQQTGKQWCRVRSNVCIPGGGSMGFRWLVEEFALLLIKSFKPQQKWSLVLVQKMFYLSHNEWWA